MRIDCHQHFWKYNAKEFGWIGDNMGILKRDFLPQHLNPLIKQLEFDGTVAVQARQSLEETRWLLKLASENDFIKGVIGWVDLCSDNIEEQLNEFTIHPKLKGVRHVLHDETDDYFMLKPEFIKGIGLLEKYDLAYDLLLFPKHLPIAYEFVKRFPHQRFVLDHISKPLIKAGSVSPWGEDIARLAGFENVYCKLSGMVTEADWQNWKDVDFRPYLDTVFQCFGTDRLMIGSDWPVCTVAGEYDKVMNLVIDYMSQYTKSEKEKVLGLNCQRIYKIAIL